MQTATLALFCKFLGAEQKHNLISRGIPLSARGSVLSNFKMAGKSLSENPTSYPYPAPGCENLPPPPGRRPLHISSMPAAL